MSEKKPVKVKFAEKWVKQTFPKDREGDFVGQVDQVGLADAYLAGFEKAKSLCIDFVTRFVDYRRDPPFSEDEEARWIKTFRSKLPPSEEMKAIGEQIV